MENIKLFFINKLKEIYIVQEIFNLKEQIEICEKFTKVLNQLKQNRKYIGTNDGESHYTTKENRGIKTTRYYCSKSENIKYTSYTVHMQINIKYDNYIYYDNFRDLLPELQWKLAHQKRIYIFEDNQKSYNRMNGF